MFDNFSHLDCGVLGPYEMETSQYNDKDSVWDTSKYHPKLSLSIFKVNVIQGHEVNERSNRKFWVWAACYMLLGHFFSSRTRKMTLEHFLNDPSQTNFENRENAEMARNSLENGLFPPSKY